MAQPDSWPRMLPGALPGPSPESELPAPGSDTLGHLGAFPPWGSVHETARLWQYWCVFLFHDASFGLRYEVSSSIYKR